MNVFVFDIETVPDVEAGTRFLGLEGLPAASVAKAMQHLAKESTGQPFVKYHLQQIVAISVLLRHDNTLKVWSLGSPQATEADLIRRFFMGIEKYTPCLVSWNGSGFDLPVLHYRALKHKIPCTRYWETGDNNSEFKWNNYLNRYHVRHIDVMDSLAGYQSKAFARLDEVAQLLGFPGKMGIAGDQVAPLFFAGEIQTIRDYCETDVMNTYLIYLRFQYIRGILSESQYNAELTLLEEHLQAAKAPHFQQFLEHWQRPMLE